MKKTLQLLALTVLAACSNDDDINSFERGLSGEYQITAISSEVSFDMDNDGIKSKDIFKEISDEHHAVDGQVVSFYNFAYFENCMKIKLDNKLISFVIPDQDIDDLTDGTVFLSSYVRKAYAYNYEYDAQNKAINTLGDTDIDNNVVLSIEVLDSGQLKLFLKKRIFDFVDSDWAETTLAFTYTKI